MHHVSCTFVTVILLLLLTFQVKLHANGQDINYEKSTDKSLPEILEDIEFAITEHNLRIVGRLHIGQAIRDQGNEDFPDYEVYLYCSLTFAKKMLELEPELINTCPGRITVRGRGNLYVISAPLWPEANADTRLNEIMNNMNEILRKIIDFSALKWPEP